MSDAIVAGRRLVGHAAVFDSLSENLGDFVEVIRAGAFTELLRTNPDVRCLINHDPDLVLGRTKSATLSLREDPAGLAFTCLLPDTSFAADLVASMERKDVAECSFSFIAGADRWSQRGDLMLREVIRVDGLFDVAVVAYPAYPTATAALRDAESDDWQVNASRRRLRLVARLLPMSTPS